MGPRQQACQNNPIFSYPHIPHEPSLAPHGPTQNFSPRTPYYPQGPPRTIWALYHNYCRQICTRRVNGESTAPVSFSSSSFFGHSMDGISEEDKYVWTYLQRGQAQTVLRSRRLIDPLPPTPRPRPDFNGMFTKFPFPWKCSAPS